MSDTIQFWESVETTDPNYTKTATVQGQKRTSVDAQYKKKMITEKFGMYGIGWGIEPESEKYERVRFENQTCILTYTATAFYVWGDTKARLPIAAQVKESYVTQSGYLKIDDEAVKKVRTDALTKGFTDLGFCADIHMGKFDDQDYVHGAQLAAQIKEHDKREEEAKRAYEEIKDWLAHEMKSAETISNPVSYNKAIERLKTKVTNKCQVAGLSSRGFVDKLESSKREEK